MEKSLPYLSKISRELVQEVGFSLVIPHAVIDLCEIPVVCDRYRERPYS